MLKINQMSFWEKSEYFSQLDYVIVGAGIVGMSTAISLKELHPDARILIVERGVLPTGASTKNAGFTCFGSPSELLSDLNKISEDKAVLLIKKRWEGLERLLSLTGKKETEHESIGSFEMFTDNENHLFRSCKEQLDYLNHLAEKAIGKKNTYSIEPNNFGFNKVNHLIKNNYEGQINTGKMMQKLHQNSVEKGILFLYGINVSSWKDHQKSVEISTGLGEITTKKLIIATNGFTQKILPEVEVSPARAQVLITKPISNLPFRGSFHYQEGFYYFRNVGDRVLLGGGRNLQLEKETTMEFETTSIILEELKKLLQTVILPNIPHKIEASWSGIMGVGETKEPIVKKISPNVGIGVRLGGMGVAIGSLIGKEIAELMEK